MTPFDSSEGNPRPSPRDSTRGMVRRTRSRMPSRVPVLTMMLSLLNHYRKGRRTREAFRGRGEWGGDGEAGGWKETDKTCRGEAATTRCLQTVPWASQHGGNQSSSSRRLFLVRPRQMTACGQSISGMEVSKEGEWRGDYDDSCHSQSAVVGAA